MLSSESTPLKDSASDWDGAGCSSAALSVAATSAVGLVGRRTLITTAVTAALSIGAVVLLSAPSKPSLNVVGAIADGTPGTSNGTTFSRAFSNFKCDPDEWKDFLKRFGLSDKGKGRILDWPTFMNKRKPCPQHNVLWLWPSDDHNSAFQINKAACYRMLKWSESACSVTVVKTTDVEHAEDSLDKYPDNSLKMVGLGGHGSPQSLSWGNCESEVHKGDICTTSEETTIWKSAHSWDTAGTLKAGSRIEALGPPVDVEGYIMLSIKQGGAVELSDLNCNAGRTCTLGRDKVSKRFLGKLSRKMYRDGSLLLDSCETAGKPKEGSRNLAEFVSDSVGKGIRVFAIDESLYTTDVKRWHPFYADLNGKPPVVNTKGATCPSWAAGSAVDEDGDCKCPAKKQCLSAMVSAKQTKCRVTRGDHLWASPSSWDKIGQVKKGDTVTAAGPPSMEEGHFMLPVLPRGAVVLSSTDCGKRCPKALGESSTRFFLPSCSNKWSTIQCGCQR